MNKVIFLIGIMGNGGAERVIAALSNDFILRGIDVKIITIYGRKQDYNLNKNIELQPILCKNKLRIIRPIERVKSIRKYVREYKPDCVISFLADVNIHTILALRKENIPIIISERNDPNNDPKNKFVRKLRDLLYKKVDGAVFQTSDAMHYFDCIMSEAIKKEIISNPLTKGLPYHEFAADNRRIITACRLDSQKNLKMMIEAVSNIIKKGTNCELDIFGTGPMHEELVSMINDLGMAEYIHLNGFSKNIHFEMQHSCMFVISSDYEGISNSMIEALAIGVPVIATDCPVGGARMFIDHMSNGILTKVGNIEELEAAIKFILDNPQEAESMGKKATNIRNELDVKVISDKWISYIDAVVSDFRKKKQ